MVLRAWIGCLCLKELTSIKSMIREWDNFCIPKEGLIDHQVDFEWFKAKITMKAREKKYGDSMRNVPYKLNRHFSNDSTAYYDSSHVAGDASNSGRYYDGNGLALLYVISDDRNHDYNDVALVGKLPGKFHCNDDFIEVPTRILEKIKKARVYHRKDAPDYYTL